MSLPVKLRPTVCEINVRPVFRLRDELLSDGILQNVIRFFAPAFVMSQPVLEEIPLPDNASFLGRPFLPFADDGFERLARWRKRNQRVNMIGHEEEKIRPPQKFFLPVTNGLEEVCGNVRYCELILEAFRAVDGDEIDFLLGINPQRDFVGQ